MTRAATGPPVGPARTTSRPPRPRDSLFASTMLAPVAVIAMLAAAKIASRRVGHPPFAQQAFLPEQRAAEPSGAAAYQRAPADEDTRENPPVAGPAGQPLARSPGDTTAPDTGGAQSDNAPAGPDPRPRDPRDGPSFDQALLRRDPEPVEPRRAAPDAAPQDGARGGPDALAQEASRSASSDDPKLGIAPSRVVAARVTGPAERGLRQTRTSAEAEPTGNADDGTSAQSAPSAAEPPRAVEAARATTDEPTSLAYPPAPFMPEQLTARGTAPSYRPVVSAANGYPYRPVLDTTPFALMAPAAPSAAQGQRQRAGEQRADSATAAANFGSGAAFGLPSDTGIPGRPAPDTLAAEIAADTAAQQGEVAPSAQAGFGARARSGDPGMDRLTAVAVPLEAEFSAAGYGRLKVAATPTTLEAGNIGLDATSLQRFGSSALGFNPAAAGSGIPAAGYKNAVPSDQRASGVGLAASYTLGVLSADVGTTPLGFPVTHVVGGVSFAPQITDALRLRLTGERRALTDSALSYAGTRDARTGTEWGGDVRTRARADVEFDIGGGRAYIGAGGGTVAGLRTLDNSELEFGAGGTFPVYRNDARNLSVGLDLGYFGYRRNLRFFTLGQGGYFSPQSYFAALVPIRYEEQVSENLSYALGAAIGVQSYHENASPYYPKDPALQAQLVAAQSDPTKAVAGLRTSYPAESRTGFAGNGHASLDYRISPNLHLGARAGILRAGNFTEASGVAYARYVFSGTDTQ